MNTSMLDEANRSSLITQGVTTGFLSAYLHQTYIAVLPWLIPCIPLMLLVSKFGRENARLKGEEVTWGKTLKMAINKIFNYICWIMIACTLSIAFSSDAITIVIMAIVYGLEVMKVILRYVQSQGYEVNERQALGVFLKIIIKKFTGEDVDPSALSSTKSNSENGNETNS